MRHALTGICIFTACLLPAFGFHPGWAQHAGAQSTPSHGAATAQAGAANAVVEFENESIVVVRIRMAPHEKTPMHDIASARLVLWLTDAYLRDTRPDGRSDDIHRRAGEIDWVPIQRHAGENLAHEPLEFLAIVPKTSGAAAVK
jgi:quercetin dioxygenase-like cupin family protein